MIILSFTLKFKVGTFVPYPLPRVNENCQYALTAVQGQRFTVCMIAMAYCLVTLEMPFHYVCAKLCLAGILASLPLLKVPHCTETLQL